jgi:hypothetical protein
MLLRAESYAKNYDRRSVAAGQGLLHLLNKFIIYEGVLQCSLPMKAAGFPSPLFSRSDG